MPPLPLAERLALIELYYQSLIQADQFDVARKALTMIREVTREPSAREYLDARLARLAMCAASSAPGSRGPTSTGGRSVWPIRRGTSCSSSSGPAWNMPNVREVGRLEELKPTIEIADYGSSGSDVDSLQDGAGGVDAILPQVRRFLIEQNVTWPNLVEGRGGSGYAKAYGVSEIPANFLVGRDGRIIHFDLAGSNLERVLTKALGQ